MQKFAIIVAGGIGQRMGTAIPKQFLLLNGKPLICHSIDVFYQAFKDIAVVVVLPAAFMKEGKKIVKEWFPHKMITITEGGDSRFQSVKNGLAKAANPSVIFVHDAVRCLVTADLITRCYFQALEKGSAIPSLAAIDSIRQVSNEQHSVIDRNRIRIIQTPQTFQSSLLIASFQNEYMDFFTDEATVAESAGYKVYLIDGEDTNIKITRPIDLLFAESILKNRNRG